jgi:hypothetical protein
MTDHGTCFYCPCPAMYSHGDAHWCEHHYWRGTDLPCPDCAPTDPDHAETLAHLETLNRRRFRLANQLRVARERLEDLEREVRTANDDFNLAQAQYLRDAARPLIDT